MTTAIEIEEWRTKIKKKIWNEFCAEPNESHGIMLMKEFDKVCDLAIKGMDSYERVGVIGTENYDSYFGMANGPMAGQWHKQDNPRLVPMLFKNLPAGTEIYIRIPNHE